MPCKLEALVWGILLEAGSDDREASLQGYCDQVISCITDQGALPSPQVLCLVSICCCVLCLGQS